jgi:RNA polymerase Rpb1 C-terminal repeat
MAWATDACDCTSRASSSANPCRVWIIAVHPMEGTTKRAAKWGHPTRCPARHGRPRPPVSLSAAQHLLQAQSGVGRSSRAEQHFDPLSFGAVHCSILTNRRSGCVWQRLASVQPDLTHVGSLVLSCDGNRKWLLTVVFCALVVSRQHPHAWPQQSKAITTLALCLQVFTFRRLKESCLLVSIASLMCTHRPAFMPVMCTLGSCQVTRMSPGASDASKPFTCRPTSPQYSPTSPQYSPASPQYRLRSMHRLPHKCYVSAAARISGGRVGSTARLPACVQVPTSTFQLCRSIY